MHSRLAKTLTLLLPSILQCSLAAMFTPEGQQVIKSSSEQGGSFPRDALKLSAVIPDVLDDFEPTYNIYISYPQSHETVKLGNRIPTKAVSTRPVFEFYDLSATGDNPSSGNKTFTIVLTDPDATSRLDPKWSEMCHWIVTNLTDHTTSDILMPKSGELIEYLPPTPPPGTGGHRYVFVLLQSQAGQVLNPPTERKHWGYGKVRHGVRDWAKDNNLEVVGANFFYAEKR